MNKREIGVGTADGVAMAGLFAPPSGKGPGVILYMDAFGPRPALDAMAARLAAHGYFVLVPDLFYRAGPYGPFDAKTAFADPERRAQLMALIQSTTQEMTVRDTAAFLDALAAEGASEPAGVVGYCMGGARALNAAAAWPERIGAAASFHGGNLASDAPDSPHRNAASIRARVYVGAAGVDASFPPEQSALLAKVLREAQVDHTIENYVGMAHGWCVPDHRVHDGKGAERHWKRLTTLFGEALLAA